MKQHVDEVHSGKKRGDRLSNKIVISEKKKSLDDESYVKCEICKKSFDNNMHLWRHEIKKHAFRDWSAEEDKTLNMRKSEEYMKVNVNTETDKGEKEKNPQDENIEGEVVNVVQDNIDVEEIGEISAFNNRLFNKTI